FRIRGGCGVFIEKVNSQYVTPIPSSVYASQLDEWFVPAELDNDETYLIGRGEKSIALIFNHFEFDSRGLNSQRKSAESDGKRLVTLLTKLNFDVRYHVNLTLDELSKEIESVAKENHSKRDCLLVMILTKGESGELYARDFSYNDKTIWKNFDASKVPSLNGKPKVFLFQSSEGMELVEAVSLQVLSAKKVKKDPDRVIPKCADFFIYHAPIKEFQSSESEHKSSFFVHEFCSQLEKYASREDFATILMHVSRKLSKRLHKTDCMPVSTSTLTKLLYLCKQP
ncbi:hypothetical protein J437_LFUL003490, partial [Ladona fulva]